MSPRPTLARIRSAALTGQSTLYVWMLNNVVSFRAILEKADGRPSWRALAEAFSEDGLRDENGNPPSPVTSRNTWIRVEKAIEARAVKVGRKKPIGRPKPPAAGIVQPVVTSPFQPTAPTKPKYEFPKFSRMKPQKEV
jgi:hypothetical protein